MKVLFICTGNTCRSPMAEGIYNAKAVPRGLAPAESAGIFCRTGNPRYGKCRYCGGEYGADISGTVPNRHGGTSG